MKSRIYLFSLIALVAITGFIVLTTPACNKTPQSNPVDKTDFSTMVINPEFKFETTQQINIHLIVENPDNTESSHKFLFYDANPASGGNLLGQGVTDPYLLFNGSLVVPATISQLYITNRSVTAAEETVGVQIVNGEVNHTFLPSGKMAGVKTAPVLHSEPDWSVYDVALSGNYSKVDIDDGLIYCVLPGTSANVTNKVVFKGGTLIVAGTLNLSKFDGSNDGGTFYVSTGGVLNLNNGSFSRIDDFVNFGTSAISSNVTLTNMTGNFENQGTMNIAGTVNINPNSGDLYNASVMNIAGHYNNNGFGYNMGNMTISGNFNNNGNPEVEFYNDCHLVVTGNLAQNQVFYNNQNAYVEVYQSSNLNGTSVTWMGAQSLWVSTDIHFNSECHGPDASGARFDISDVTNINGDGYLDGYLDINDADGIENDNGYVGPHVTFDGGFFIPTTSCNPGAGTPGDPDSDMDGCPDSQDDYPTDPTRCTNDYYPNETDFNSLAFEDLWTGTGDYDFNDLVIETNYKIVKNAENKVVELIARFHIAAVGAGLNNGFGIEFDVPTSAISSATPTQIDGSAVTIGANGMEDGPINKAVLIAYSAINTYLGASMVNTIPGGSTMEIDTMTVTITFATPQSNIGTPPYNPFLFVDQDRGKEIHLIDHAPTELVDAAFFGQEADDSDPAIGRYYVTETNLPWVIEVPASFEWPIEKADILTAYLKFRDWAESSGTTYTDWYENLSGYRNNSNIYQQVAN